MLGPHAIIILLFLAMLFTKPGFSLDSLLETITFGLPAILVAFSVHEFAHAYMAYKLGDDTPKHQGRLTLDIRKHVDVIGLLMLLFFGFGWAKPVEVDFRNLKNPKRDMALVAFAGPFVNILVAIISVIIFAKFPAMGDKFKILLQYFFIKNAGLAVFNLIPIPPLDGSRIIGAFMTNKAYYKYQEFEHKYYPFLLFGLLIFGGQVFGSILFRLIIMIESLGLSIARILPF